MKMSEAMFMVNLSVSTRVSQDAVSECLNQKSLGHLF